MITFGFFLTTTPRAHPVPDVAEVSTCSCKREVTEAQQVRGDQTPSFPRQCGHVAPREASRSTQQGFQETGFVPSMCSSLLKLTSWKSGLEGPRAMG